MNSAARALLRPLVAPLWPAFRELIVLSTFVNLLALGVPIFVMQVYDRVVFHAGLATLQGLVIGIAGKLFAVDTDPRIEKVTEMLPGANCGGCGRAGCADFAKAVCAGEILPGGCPVNGMESIAAIAERSGRTPQAVALDEMMARDGKGLLMLPFENYAYGSLDVVHEMITDPATVLGVADGGAHVGVICDASSPTSLLTLWGRDRTRGPKLGLEFLIAKQTRGTAEAYGLMDRGLLAPGHKADINVIDFDALTLKRPEVVYDLPAGGRRLIQRASGYRHTFNAGVETMQNDELTGERPGRLVRGAQTPA